ncbi:MAG: YIP1 family protein [Prevotellaceae bacterium]|jgi:hypothetical protein|nr:YIP1 family protein [Prevotellaceae bacterium]
MEIISKVKNIPVTPKTEWQVIETENKPHMKVFTNYVVPLSLIPAVAAFIGYGLVGYSVFGVHFSNVGWGIRQAIVQYAAILCGTYITALIINTLSDSFGVKKDFGRAFSLVAYTYTPMFVAGMFYILPALWWLASLAGLYSLYLLYIGLQAIMKVPADKQSSYCIISLIITVTVFGVLSLILTTILLRGTYLRF